MVYRRLDFSCTTTKNPNLHDEDIQSNVVRQTSYVIVQPFEKGNDLMRVKSKPLESIPIVDIICHLIDRAATGRRIKSFLYGSIREWSRTFVNVWYWRNWTVWIPMVIECVRRLCTKLYCLQQVLKRPMSMTSRGHLPFRFTEWLTIFKLRYNKSKEPRITWYWSWKVIKSAQDNDHCQRSFPQTALYQAFQHVCFYPHRKRIIRRNCLHYIWKTETIRRLEVVATVQISDTTI